MEALPARVIQYFNGEKQHLIPLFQRPYTWTQNNWQTFQQTNWRAAEIEERAKELLVIANKIWMSPSEMTAD